MIPTSDHSSLDEADITKDEIKKDIQTHLDKTIFEDADKFVFRNGNVYYRAESKSYRDRLLHNIPLEETFEPRKPRPLESVIPIDKYEKQKSSPVFTMGDHHKRDNKFSKNFREFRRIYKLHRNLKNRKKIHHQEYQRDRAKKYSDPAMERPEDYDYDDFVFDDCVSIGSYDFAHDYWAPHYEYPDSDDDYDPFGDFDDDYPFDDY